MDDLLPGEVVAAVRDEQLVLLPERGVFWPRVGTLLIADPHWGKAATFRALGVPVPRGTTRVCPASISAHG